MHADNLTTPLTQLEHGDEFIGRHIGPNEHVIGGMLAAIGTASLSTLIGETVPATIRLQRPLDLPAPMPEHAALAALKAIAAKNVVTKSKRESHSSLARCVDQFPSGTKVFQKPA